MPIQIISFIVLVALSTLKAMEQSQIVPVQAEYRIENNKILLDSRIKLVVYIRQTLGQDKAQLIYKSLLSDMVYTLSEQSDYINIWHCVLILRHIIEYDLKNAEKLGEQAIQEFLSNLLSSFAEQQVYNDTPDCAIALRDSISNLLATPDITYTIENYESMLRALDGLYTIMRYKFLPALKPACLSTHTIDLIIIMRKRIVLCYKCVRCVDNMHLLELFLNAYESIAQVSTDTQKQEFLKSLVMQKFEKVLEIMQFLQQNSEITEQEELTLQEWRIKFEELKKAINGEIILTHDINA